MGTTVVSYNAPVCPHLVKEVKSKTSYGGRAVGVCGELGGTGWFEQGLIVSWDDSTVGCIDFVQKNSPESCRWYFRLFRKNILFDITPKNVPKVDVPVVVEDSCEWRLCLLSSRKGT